MAPLYVLIALIFAAAWPVAAAAQDLPGVDIDIDEPEVELPDLDEPIEEIEEAVGEAVEGIEAAGEEALSQAAAIRAVRENRALPLDRVLALAAGAIKGQVIDVRLITWQGRLVYEVKVLTASGMVTSLYFEATTGTQIAAGQP
jgi:uncharacterized membrane protein YkoI